MEDNTETMKFTGIVLWVQENRLSEKFYKKLGFVVTENSDDHSVVRLGNFEMTLVSMRDEEPFTKDSMTGTKGRGLYIYLRVENVYQAHCDLVSSGIQPNTQPKDWPWGNREFIVKDPDGYKICIWSPIAQ